MDSTVGKLLEAEAENGKEWPELRVADDGQKRRVSPRFS